MSLRMLEVTAHLSSAVAVSHDVHIDGMIAKVWHARIDPDATITRATPASEIPDIALPLARVRGYEGEWCWAASAWSLPEGAQVERAEFTKRRDTVDLDEASRIFTPNAGPGRNYQVRLTTALAPTARWLVVGDRHEVRNALKMVHSIGGTRRQGFGVVRSWSVEPVERWPGEVLVDSTGRAARNLPLTLLDSWEGEPDLQPIRPPYWHPGRAVRCVRPGTRCALRAEVRRKIDELCRCEGRGAAAG